MTRLESGHITTTTNTPTGARKMVAVDNPYCTKDDFIKSSIARGLGITALSPEYSNGQLDEILLEASAEINRKCRRWFDTQTIDETKTSFMVHPYDPQLVTIVVQNRPYQKINRCFIEVLKWFVEVDVTSASSYVQDFPDLGYFKIVPLLSSSGQGAGSPIPSNIIDRIALGVLWYNYTFGYGTALTAQTLSQPTGIADKVTYQAVQGNRLWAPSQTINVYKNGTLLATSAYTITDYANGIITLTTAITTEVITADFVTNESIPADIRKATILQTGYNIGLEGSNPLGLSSLSIQTYSASYGGNKNKIEERIDGILAKYQNDLPKFI
jgi:hypothetical protein